MTAAELSQRHPRLAELFGVDLRTLALFRVLLGVVLLVTLLHAAPDVRAFFSDWGVMPRTWMLESDSQHRLSLYILDGSTLYASLLLGLQCVAALMLALGWRTRLAALLSFVLYGSLLNRNPMLLIGGDLLLMCLLFWSLFLPLAARYSVDAALAAQSPPQENRYLSWASAALLVQVMSVYFFSAILKHAPQWVPDYTAVYYALSLDRYATPLGQWLLNFPAFLTLLTGCVWWLQMLGPLLIFSPLLNRPLRLVILLAFVTLHVGLLLCLELGHFPFVSLCALSAFTGGWLWDALARRDQQHNAGELRIYYDRDCVFCLRSGLLLQQFLILPRAQLLPAQDTPRARTLLEANNSWVVMDTDDQAHLKWAAFATLLRRSPLFGWLWPLARQQKLQGPGNAAYDWVARHRARIAHAFTQLPGAAHNPVWEVSFRWQRVAAVFMAAVFLANVASVEPALQHWFKSYHGQLKTVATHINAAVTAPMRLLRIDQFWNMFSPRPLINDGWMVIPARLANGREVDLLHPDRAPDFSKPHHYSQTHENIRWHTYRGRLLEPEFKQNALHYARYLCRDWNAPRLDDPELRAERLMTFKVIYVAEPTPLPGKATQTEQQVLWRHECFPDETKGQIP